MKFDFNFSDFGKRQFIIGKSESTLSESKGIVSSFVLKTRETSLTFLRSYTAKEALKGFLNSFENILRNLTVNVFIFGIRFFNVAELVSLVVIVQRNSIEFVGIPPFLQTCIVQITAQIERSFEFGYLSLTWKMRKRKVLDMLFSVVFFILPL